MTYVLQNRKGLNFFRWLWLLAKLNKVLFHDVQREIDSGEQVIHMLPHIYLIYKVIETKGTRIQGARAIPRGGQLTTIRQEGKDYPII